MDHARNVPDDVLKLLELRQAESCPFRCLLRFQHAQEAKVLGDIADNKAQEETIVERRELLLFGQLVAGAEKRQQRPRQQRC